ncbi:MAG: VWA domain-containing protein [Planctomycetota bacterium]|nr:VWA domain-containing protein [Planctomycetota bacterium]MDA1211234.1 VWA domain-containing protein [Planctomycetota bacterium]
MARFEYSRWDGSQQFSPQSADQLFDQISEYLLHYGDDAMPALEEWGEENPELLEMLIKRGYIEKDEEGRYVVTPRGVRRVETKALEELLNVTNCDAVGRHETEHRGAGQTMHDEWKPYEYGDSLSQLNLHETLKNALLRKGGKTPVEISEEDLVLYDTQYQSACATVVLLDMSGSMGRYGKYGQAKKIAMALQALIRAKYPSDFLQIVGFYTYATPLTERQLLKSAPKPVSIYDPRVRLRIPLDRPSGFVPEHFTNLHAGLQVARRILSRQPFQNRQMLIITDGEPTAHVEGRDVMLIYPPAEITAQITLREAKRIANEGVHVASFALIEDYFYLDLVNFVEELARVTGGISATCNAENMAQMVLSSYIKGRRTRKAM